MIGKPYSGKPNVRFDEGELEIELLATTPALYSTEDRRPQDGQGEHLRPENIEPVSFKEDSPDDEQEIPKGV